MNHQKYRVQVGWDFCIRMRFVQRNFGVVASFCLEQDDNIEEEGDEDKGDAGEDPLGKDGQPEFECDQDQD